MRPEYVFPTENWEILIKSQQIIFEKYNFSLRKKLRIPEISQLGRVPVGDVCSYGSVGRGKGASAPAAALARVLHSCVSVTENVCNRKHWTLKIWWFQLELCRGRPKWLDTFRIPYYRKVLQRITQCGKGKLYAQNILSRRFVDWLTDWLCDRQIEHWCLV